MPVALGLRGDGDVVGARLHPGLREAERLDGARALDGLGERGVDAGVRRALGDVRLRSASQVGADGRGAHREDGECGQREHERVEHHRHDRQEDGHQRDQQARDAPLHRACHRPDVAGDAGDEVARARSLDAADREPQDRADHVLACGGEEVLAEVRGGPLGTEGEDRLQDHHPDHGQGEGVETGSRGTVGVDPVDQRPEQPRDHQRGAGGECVEEDEQREGALAAADQVAEEGEHGAVAGHGPATHRVARGGVHVLGALAPQVVALPEGVVALAQPDVTGRVQLGRDDRRVGGPVAPRVGGGGQEVGGHRTGSSSSSSRVTTRR